MCYEIEEGRENGVWGRVFEGDSIELLKNVADGSVDAIITDPPYGIGGKFVGRSYQKDKGLQEWDRFDSELGFLEFIEGYLDEFKRVLKPTGSLYVFAAPKYASRIEDKISERFNVLNHIV